MRFWAALALVAGLVAALMVAGAGPLYRFQGIGLGFAFSLMRYGAWVGIIAAAGALAGVIGALTLRRRAAGIVSLVALLAGLGAFIWPYSLLQGARAVPPIHDIATDPMHAPRFNALAKVRAKAPNGVNYGGGGAQVAKFEVSSLAHFLNSPAGEKNPRHKEIATYCKTWGPICLAAVQHAYYPSITPLLARGVAREKAYAAALATARGMGWQIDAADPHAGHIEATATTAWFGFKDDIAIDVTPFNGSSVVNVRSESRLGLSDLGKNARRVRTYLRRLDHRLGLPPESSSEGMKRG